LKLPQLRIPICSRCIVVIVDDRKAASALWGSALGEEPENLAGSSLERTN